MRKAVKAVTIEQALFRFLAWLQTIHWVNHQQRLLLGYKSKGNNQQLLDEVEQNIVICQWRADQLFAEAEG